MSELKKVGIMGGTFDPIHIGHLILAQAAYEQLGLDEVLFIPSGRPPHKKNRKGASDTQRIDMVNLSICDDDRFKIDLIEMNSDDYSYTCETLEKLKKIHPNDDYYFIIGQDSLETFSSWYKPDEIIKNAHIVAADRPDCDQEHFNDQLQSNRDKLGGDFIGIKCPDIQISSHEIREMVKEGKAFKYFVTENVYKYIKDNSIYLD